MGGSAGATGGLYKTIVTVLIESCALYAVSFILFIGPWIPGSPVANIFLPIVVDAQVIAPFLVVLRVANQRALTSETAVSRADEIRFKGQKDSTIHDGKTLSEFEFGVATTEVHHSSAHSAFH